MDHRLVDVAVLGRSVELVAAAPEDDRHESADRVQELGRRAGGVELRLFERVLRGRDLRAGTVGGSDSGFLAIDAIHRLAHGAGRCPSTVNPPIEFAPGM